MSTVNKDFTKLLLDDGSEQEVGDLAMGARVSNPRGMWPISETPYVFLSHTGRDNVKEEIARPTHWFLTEVCKYDAFLDDASALAGTEKTRAMLEPAYRCTHALVLMSPSYRTRPYCVQELNTFISRHAQEPESFRLIPALWLLQDTRGYNRIMDDLIWFRDGNSAAGSYMIHSLWPRLLRELHHEAMDPLALEEALVKYVHTHRGRHRSIPPCLESFVAGSDLPREIISRRCWQLESFSDLSALSDLRLSLAGSSMSDSFRASGSQTIQTGAKASQTRTAVSEETTRLRTIKQFWKLESGAAGKLVRMECTLSKFAPFTIGKPWLKAQIHLNERQKMERSNYEPSQEAKANAMLAVTAGQMVLRAGEFQHFGDYQYFGLYQAIVRNSIPLFVTSSYYRDSLFQIMENHAVDAFEGIIVGRVVELPKEFCTAFADYMDTEEVGSDIIAEKNKTLFAIEVGGEGTWIEYIKQTPYLDGDVWVAVKEEGVTTFKSRFCNIADREDLLAAIDSLKGEIHGKNIVFQFDQVEKRFRDGDEEVYSFRGRRHKS